MTTTVPGESNLLTESASAELRQGDVCEIELFPHWVLNTSPIVSIGTEATHIQMSALPKVTPSRRAPKKRLVVVCSYDCDLENPRDRKGILLAPLMPVTRRNPNFQGIVDSAPLKTSDDGRNYFDFLPYFPIPVEGVAIEPLEFGAADFSAITSFGKPEEASHLLLAGKVAELTNETRMLFQTKLAVFVGRPEQILNSRNEAAA